MQKCQKIFILLFEVLTYPIHARSSSEYPIFNSMYIKLLIILILSWFQILQHLNKLEAVNLIVPKLTVAYH